MLSLDTINRQQPQEWGSVCFFHHHLLMNMHNADMPVPLCHHNNIDHQLVAVVKYCMQIMHACVLIRQSANCHCKWACTGWMLVRLFFSTCVAFHRDHFVLHAKWFLNDWVSSSVSGTLTLMSPIDPARFYMNANRIRICVCAILACLDVQRSADDCCILYWAFHDCERSSDQCRIQNKCRAIIGQFCS